MDAPFYITVFGLSGRHLQSLFRNYPVSFRDRLINSTKLRPGTKIVYASIVLFPDAKTLFGPLGIGVRQATLTNLEGQLRTDLVAFKRDESRPDPVKRPPGQGLSGWVSQHDDPNLKTCEVIPKLWAERQVIEPTVTRTQIESALTYSRWKRKMDVNRANRQA